MGRQSEERYYVDGFLEAAIELATAVIEKALSGQRDTLVMPILFNARHGLELSLKHAIRELSAGGLLKGALPKNHDIAALWQALSNMPRCDVHLPRLIAAAEPFVRSLATVDDDGQALRYYERRDGTRSLEDRSLVNLEVILASLRKLQEILQDLGHRAIDLVDERRSGTFTNTCSRLDLFMIASRLPPRRDWDAPSFDATRAAICDEFELSKAQLSEALNIIQRHRQLGAMLGLESELTHLDDKSAVRAVELWRSANPRSAEPQPSGGFIVQARAISFEEIERHKQALGRAARQLIAELSVNALADLEAVWRIGRTGIWPEGYLALLERTKAEYAIQGSLIEKANYMLSKSNFGPVLSDGVARLGRQELGDTLKAI